MPVLIYYHHMNIDNLTLFSRQLLILIIAVINNFYIIIKYTTVKMSIPSLGLNWPKWQSQYTQNPYQNQWNSLYPGQPYPTPQSNPNMFPPGSHTHQLVNNYDPFSVDCTLWSTCPMGLLDYKCQLAHSCYVNLAQLALYLLLFFMGIMIWIAVVGKLISVLYNLFSSILFIHRVISCITGVLKCFSFGMLERDVVVQVQSSDKKKLSDKHYYIKKKLQQIDLQLNIETLDDFKIKTIYEMLDDYQIIFNQDSITPDTQ